MKPDVQICRFSILKTFAEKYFLTTILAFGLSLNTFAQVRDNFGDGNFTTNPAWQGNTDRFTVTSGQLRLNAPQEAGDAWLFTPSAAILSAVWELRISMDFNPSANNYTRIYLTADQGDFSGSLNGYFVMIGNTEDDVCLYRQTGTTRKKIIDGTDDRTDVAAATMRIRVTRDAAGNWQLFSDAGATGNFVAEGAVNDATHTRSDYFGIYCRYTETRADKFRFDDVVVTGSAYPDNTPPAVQTVKVVSTNILDIVYTEPVEQTSASETTHYTADQTLGHPNQATLQADRRTVRLVFTKAFPQNVRCSLTIAGISDLAGNMLNAETSFVYFVPASARYRDIIITEIMADPSPAVGLPETEFVEIFNRSKDALDLVAWTLTDGTTTATLPQYILLPGEYAIITDAPELFSKNIRTIAGASFPSLNNSGDMLVLADSAGLTIDSLTYSDTWYKSSTKKDGGWTLERIDPEDPCRAGENWAASEARAGGTPGLQNTIFASNPDNMGPAVIAAIPRSPDSLKIKFSERLDNTSITMADIRITPGVDAASSIRFANAARTEMIFAVTPPLQPGIRYTLVVQNIRDCSGNPLQPGHNTTIFSLPQPADSLDIIVNEVLFNPHPTGVDFVELVNTSDKFINLKNWSLASLEEDGTLKTKRIITEDDHLMAPGDYRAITEDGNILKSEYLQGREENFLETTLPPLNDDAGSVVLLNDLNQRIDQMYYTDNLHSVFIRDPEGVSLERIHMDQPAEAQNWKSAAAAVGFATPGYRNSNSLDGTIQDDAVTIEPEIFIPVYGTPDFTQIRYRFDHGGYIANARIYDAQGHLIRELAQNEQLSTEGFLRWDGDRDNGMKARVGQYMVWLEVFDDVGNLKTFRKRVVIADKF